MNSIAPRAPHVLPIPPDVQVLIDLPYITGGDPRQQLDLYLPPDDGKPRPVVVAIHGGGWVQGDKSAPSLFLSLVARGYVGVSINYRLTGQATYPAQVQDCKAAVRWLRANAAKYNLDSDHIGLWGGSAGGQLAAVLGTSADVREFEVGENLEYSSRVQAVCSNSGIYDMIAAPEIPTLEKKDRDSLVQLLSGLFGGPPHLNPELAAKANPLTYLGSDAAPFLLITGTNDLISAHQSALLHAALQKAGIPSTFILVKDGGHDGPEYRTPEMLGRIGDFFDLYLSK